MENIKTDFTEHELDILFKIISIEDKQFSKNMLYSLLEKFDKTEIDKIAKYLYDKDILVNNMNSLFLYHKKLRDLIDEQILTNKFYKYFFQWHFCHW